MNLRAILRNIRRPYRVIPLDRTTNPPTVMREHRAASVAEALEWVACHPTWASVTVYTRTGRFVAHRYAKGQA